jgi:hypothetical protein
MVAVSTLIVPPSTAPLLKSSGYRAGPPVRSPIEGVLSAVAGALIRLRPVDQPDPRHRAPEVRALPPKGERSVLVAGEVEVAGGSPVRRRVDRRYVLGVRCRGRRPRLAKAVTRRGHRARRARFPLRRAPHCRRTTAESSATWGAKRGGGRAARPDAWHVNRHQVRGIIVCHLSLSLDRILRPRFKISSLSIAARTMSRTMPSLSIRMWVGKLAIG